MVDKSDKTKSKNWINGDTFAIKIHIRKNTRFIYDKYFDEYLEYEGKYIVIIYTDDTDWGFSKTSKYFRAKLFDEMPTTFEEIDKKEYIIISARDYDRELIRFPKIVSKIHPDQYNNIYNYIFDISVDDEKTVKGLKYVGNFSYTRPKNEYIVENMFQGIWGVLPSTLISGLLSKYISFNLKREDWFSEEGVAERKATLSNWYEEEYLFYDRLKKLGDELDGPNGKEILKKMGIDIDKEIHHESETYVGDENFKE